jgi:uncharacterized membrane protein YagU involved in acid resistance
VTDPVVTTDAIVPIDAQGPRLASVGVIAGVAGGAAMVPLGLLVRALGAPVNVYGELLLARLTGQVQPLGLFVEHALVSIALAGPLVLVIWRLRMRSAYLVGLAYGAMAWALVNATILPVVFGRPTAWQLDISESWGSLAVHLVYGLVTAAVASRLLARATVDPTPRGSH